MNNDEILLSENKKSKTLTKRHAVLPDHTVEIRTLYRLSCEFKGNLIFFPLNYSYIALYFRPNAVCEIVAI